MTVRGRSIEQRRAMCWPMGIQHREMLLRAHMDRNGLSERPFLKDVVDDIIEEVQHARLLQGVLPLDTFGQTTVVGGRIEVTINSRIAEMPGVKDAAGVAYVSKWHESWHVEHDMEAGVAEAQRMQQLLPGLDAVMPKLIVCRSTRPLEPIDIQREFVAENAALAAAIAGPDLARCSEFLRFRRLAPDGGKLQSSAWQLLYKTAEVIGVNITALVRYCQQRGLFYVVQYEGIIANPSLGAVDWL